MTQRTCDVPECQKPVARRTWCTTHYQRWRVHGDPEKTAVRKRGICDFAECGRSSATRGLCASHGRQRDEGKPLTAIRVWRSHLDRNEQGHKLCRTCVQWLSESEFGKSRRQPDGLGYQCRKCNRDKHRLANFGMTWAQYQQLLADQGGGCAVCGSACSTGRLLAIDHDHACCPEVGRSCGRCVRGLLCGGCNQGLGKFHDDSVLLRAAAAYVERHRGAA